MYKSKRSKACDIPMKVKQAVLERDQHCIFCGGPGAPNAHVVPRSHGGLGVETNIITACTRCHDRLDNSVERADMLDFAMRYLEQLYPGWRKEDQVWKKY